MKVLVTGYLTTKITQERERQAPGRERQRHCLPGHGSRAIPVAVAEPLLFTPGAANQFSECGSGTGMPERQGSGEPSP